MVILAIMLKRFFTSNFKQEVPTRIPYTERMKNKNNVNNPINLTVLFISIAVVVINIIAFVLLPR